jgi:hypothetical protein
MVGYQAPYQTAEADVKALRCTLAKIISENSMSVALLTLFMLCIIGQGLSGWFAYNQSLRAGHFPEMPFSIYLGTGNFLDGTLSNWQAAILQLAVLIVFGSVLRQKGAAHSRKVDVHHQIPELKIGTRLTLHDWVYANSLSLAFGGMFLATFLLHLLFGEWKYNEDQALRHLPPASLGSFACSSNFWFSVLQCWEAEFGAIGLYILFSIFLRQEGSSESKPVGASNSQTGGANE